MDSACRVEFGPHDNMLAVKDGTGNENTLKCKDLLVSAVSSFWQVRGPRAVPVMNWNVPRLSVLLGLPFLVPAESGT